MKKRKKKRKKKNLKEEQASVVIVNRILQTHQHGGTVSLSHSTRCIMFKYEKKKKNTPKNRQEIPSEITLMSLLVKCFLLS